MMLKILLTSVIISLTMVTSARSNDTTSVLHYLVREPKIKSEKPPLLIMLHGVGSNEEDLFSFADQLPGKYLLISARAPIILGSNSFAWYHLDLSTGKPEFNFDEEEKSKNLIIRFIGQLKEKYSVDEKNIYLLGFSQGAIMSYSVALTRPDLVKGIAVMSGRLLEEIKPEIVTKDQLKQLKIFISHGTDDNTLSIKYAREAEVYLKSLSLSFVYKEYKAGHEINLEMFSNLLTWLK